MNQLVLDLNRKSELNRFWEFGANTCHAALWQREDLIRQMTRMRKELGFRYVRFHGVLNDDMDVMRKDGSFHFERVIRVYENVRNAGMKPYVELSSMPSVLASSEKSLCAYAFRSAPPVCWKTYRELIAAFARALTDHFGSEEVKTWYFEVWNEPDISFWSGTMAEYFKMYDIARSAVKSVCPEYRVGGPATSKTAWIPEFVAHASKPSEEEPSEGIRCDFVATHAYPSDLAFLDNADGKVNLQEAGVLRALFLKARAVIDRAWGSGFPLFIGEWNSSAGPLVPNHDECNNAPFICKTMADLRGICAGSLYWNASDIYEECNFHYTPFHGGYGLMNVNDLPKSSYHAFRFLHELGNTEVHAEFDGVPHEEHGVLASRDGSELRILVWNYRQPGTDGEGLTFRISGLPAECSGTVERILPGQGSPYETWIELGKPDYVNRSILDTLERASETVVSDVKSSDSITISVGSAALLKFLCR